MVGFSQKIEKEINRGLAPIFSTPENWCQSPILFVTEGIDGAGSRCSDGLKAHR